MRQFFGHPIGIGVTVFIIVFGAGFLMKNAGYHFEGIKVVQGGDVAIALPETATEIFLNERQLTLPDQEENSRITLLENLSPEKHSLLIFNDQYWPWKKDIEVMPNETISVTPFLIKKNASGVIVTNKDSEYNTLARSILNQQLPTKDAPKTSPSGLVSLWVEDNAVQARWNGTSEALPEYFCTDEKVCRATTTILSSVDPIRNVDFYRDYEAIAMVAFANGIFAIEIDMRGDTQNFQPIYKGAELPRFSKADENTINVIDGSAIFIIDL